MYPMVDRKELEEIWRQIISETFKAYRTKLGLTQKDVAEAINCDEIHYGRIERGDKLPGGLLLGLIVIALEIDFSELMNEYKQKEAEYYRRYE